MSNQREESTMIVSKYGHGSITLTAYQSSGRISVETRGTNPVMDISEFLEFAARLTEPKS